LRNCFIRKASVYVLAAFLSACGGPAWYSMPPQRHPSTGPDPPDWRSFVKFNDPDQSGFVVQDIGPGDGQAWTFDHPELRFRVRPRPGLRFALTIRMAGQTLRDTGPVTITIKINGHLLGEIRTVLEGDYHFEQAVPVDWITIGEPVHVAMEANPLWTDPSNPPGGMRLGFLIVEAGFR